MRKKYCRVTHGRVPDFTTQRRAKISSGMTVCVVRYFWPPEDSPRKDLSLLKIYFFLKNIFGGETFI